MLAEAARADVSPGMEASTEEGGMRERGRKMRDGIKGKWDGRHGQSSPDSPRGLVDSWDWAIKVGTGRMW